MNTIDFLKSFSGNIEISNLKEVKEMNNNENFYFLSWVKHKDKRNWDRDIVEKNYFAIDIDIRTLIAKEWDITPEDIKDSEIISTAETFKDFVKWKEFWDWRYIVFSWNWLHLYYTGKTMKVPEDITPSEYQDAMMAYHYEFKSIFESPYMIPDPACINIWRVFRLPWSYNQRTKFPTLGKTQCKILYSQDIDSKLVDDMPRIGKVIQEKKIELLKRDSERRKKEREVKILSWELNSDNEKLKEELKNIPIEDVFDKLWIIQTAWFNGRNWIDPRDRTYFSFWKDKDNFIHVANSTTLAPYSDWKDWLDNFSLVMNVLWIDFKNSIEWLKNNFYSK